MMRSKDDSVLCVNGSSPPLLSRCNSDGAPMMHQQGRKSFDAADLDQLSAELGLIGTSGLEKEAQLRTAHLSWPRDDVSSQAVCHCLRLVDLSLTSLLAAAGGRVIFSGSAEHFLIGPMEEAWDHVLLVRYPSAQAFLGFASDSAYLAGAGHRTAALADSRLLPMTPEGDEGADQPS